MLQGTINSIVDSFEGKKVVYYQVDLELVDLESNTKVWLGDKKIKKAILNMTTIEIKNLMVNEI